MKIFFTDPFRRDYSGLPRDIQRALDKALVFLSSNLRHPSLRVKKLPSTEIWYARIARGWRFTFQFDGDTAVLRRAGTHSVLDQERRK